MRYCRIDVGGDPRWGRVGADEIHLLRSSPIGGDPAPDGTVVPLAGAAFLPPVVPGVFYAVGYNYRGHISHAGVALPARPEVGYRANNALTGHGSPIVRPAGVTGRFEAEPEVVAVVGRTLRRASRAEAQESVFGWTIGNDVTERAWQKNDPTNLRGKNADTFKPMGPWIATGIEPCDMTTTVHLNGETLHKFPTGDMLFSAGEVISDISRTNTLSPGDVVWLGTDELPQSIEPGDTIEIEISGIGVLRNRVVAGQ